MLKFPSSSTDGLITRRGDTVTAAIVCRAEDEMDFETGLVGLELFFEEELEDERERRCCREFRELCCVQPAT